MGWLARLSVPLQLALVAVTAMLAPALHAAVVGDLRTARAFLYGAMVLGVLIAALALATARGTTTRRFRNPLILIVGAYAVLPLVCAVPFWQARNAYALGPVWFEMLSSFTTTGASAFDAATLPESLHLWRAVVGWLGGLFLLTMTLAVLAPMNLGGTEVVTGRTPGQVTAGGQMGGAQGGDSMRIRRHAALILPVYGGATLALWIALMLAGERSLDGLILAMSTLSTSGITGQPHAAPMASGRLGEVLVALFLCLALSRQILVRFSGIEKARFDPRRDPELAMAALALLLVAALLVLRLVLNGVEGASVSLRDAASALWGALFTGLSFLTTTGFVSADWSAVDSPPLLLLALAIIGGGVATTASGVKLLRVYALFRHGQHELDRLILPSVVGGAGQSARRIRREGANLAWTFFVLFAISIAVTSGLLTISGLTYEEALLATLSSLTNTGPLLPAADPGGWDWIDATGFQRLLGGLAMVVGRLETLAILAFLLLEDWRR